MNCWPYQLEGRPGLDYPRTYARRRRRADDMGLRRDCCDLVPPGENRPGDSTRRLVGDAPKALVPSWLDETELAPLIWLLARR